MYRFVPLDITWKKWRPRIIIVSVVIGIVMLILHLAVFGKGECFCPCLVFNRGISG